MRVLAGAGGMITCAKGVESRLVDVLYGTRLHENVRGQIEHAEIHGQSLPLNDISMVLYTICDWLLDVDFRGSLSQWCGVDTELYTACNAQMIKDGVAHA